jgi:hypothetical protein
MTKVTSYELEANANASANANANASANAIEKQTCPSDRVHSSLN